MKELLTAIVFFLILFTYSVFPVKALQLMGEGYGKNKTEAKKEALADLSSAIQAEVQSNFQSIARQSGEDVKNFVEKIIKIKSELPILGAEYDFSYLENDIIAKALLDSVKVLKLYETKLKDVRKEMDHSLELLDRAETNSGRHSILTELLTLLEQYYKYKTVAIFLESKNIPELSITEVEIKNQLRKIEKKVDSIDLATKLIAKGISQKKIYIYPLKTKDSNEITPFAGTVKNKLSAYLSTTLSPKHAHYFMTGEYEILKEGVHLTYHLLDVNFNTLKTRVAELSPRAYTGYEIHPKTIDFDKLLHEGIVVSSDFRIEISTNKGKRELLFKEAETLELFVKANRQANFYIVGYILKTEEKLSYLLELQDGMGKSKFVYFINADDVNKWISLGNFKVIAPFGVESLQIVACSDRNKLQERIPSYKYNSKLGYNIVSRDPKSGVKKTRGLLRDKDEKNVFIENVIMFTTMKK